MFMQFQLGGNTIKVHRSHILLEVQGHTQCFYFIFFEVHCEKNQATLRFGSQPTFISFFIFIFLWIKSILPLSIRDYWDLSCETPSFPLVYFPVMISFSTHISSHPICRLISHQFTRSFMSRLISSHPSSCLFSGVLLSVIL